MVYCTCPNPDCGAELIVYENDTTPGCREMEEYLCPCCGKQAGSVFTSGIPSVEVRKPGKKDRLGGPREMGLSPRTSTWA